MWEWSENLLNLLLNFEYILATIRINRLFSISILFYVSSELQNVKVSEVIYRIRIILIIQDSWNIMSFVYRPYILYSLILLLCIKCVPLFFLINNLYFSFEIMSFLLIFLNSSGMMHQSLLKVRFFFLSKTLRLRLQHWLHLGCVVVYNPIIWFRNNPKWHWKYTKRKLFYTNKYK